MRLPNLRHAVFTGAACAAALAIFSDAIAWATNSGSGSNQPAAQSEMGVSANPELAEMRAKNSELLRQVRAFIGRPCAPHLPPENLPGFKPIPGFRPVIVRDGFVHARSKDGRRFAFLLIAHDADEEKTCRIADVVSLPSAKEANAFLRCDVPDVPGPGVGLRLVGKREIVDYWYIDVVTARLKAISLDGTAQKSTRCQVPEYGE